jgi:hypothetical protein
VRRGAVAAAALVLAVAAPPARAQTMLDQEERLIDIHSLLLDLPPLGSPGALRPMQLSVALEAVTIPDIDGQTGSKRQITASDRTPLFPRPRVALGLPAPEGFRALVGLSYIPPVVIREVSTHFGAAEAAFAWIPGTLRVGARAHLSYGFSRSPVTDPSTRDTLETTEYGGELSAGGSFPLSLGTLEPYGGLGAVHLRGRFRVTSDGTVLRSDYAGASLHGGLRFLIRDRWEAVAEVDAYPGRLVHTNFKAGYLFF